MKLVRERTVGSGGGGEVVVVGVKFDGESRELLTWSLMKMAQPGDRVVALHVIDSVSEFVGGTAPLLSLVQTFDSLLAVYEGFCNLKQVDLKLKVCRGSSPKKILVREAKASGAAKVIVGTSKTHHSIKSSTSVAKYCARNLSRSLSVFAVNNGKILFQREASPVSSDRLHEKLNRVSKICSRKSRKKESESCAPSDDSKTQLSEESCNEGDGLDNSLAMVPFQTREAVLNLTSTTVKGSKHGWSVLRRVFFPKPQDSEKSSHVKKTSMVNWVSRLPSRNSSSVVYPDQKQSISHMNENDVLKLEGERGAIVPVEPEVPWSPISPSHGLDGLPEELVNLHEKYSSSYRLFSYEELLLATSNFKPENMVGKGGSSHVYKGCLPDGKELAVKILKPSEDVLKEFVVEIETISTLHHKNIISLFGFCFEHNNLLLVYDFLSRGSLEENLHGNKKDWNAFGWRERYKVAVGVAEALDYLHNVSERPVIHRDVKSSNILLSDDFEPQLSDFGLATWASTSSHITCTDVSGTFGYLAPEYFMHGKVSDKVDVFAFGVVLLELLSGRMPINSQNTKGRESLVMWAKPILEGGKVSELLDPYITSENDNNEIERMVLAATLCIRRSPKSRPLISLVLKLLQGDEEVINWAKQQVIASEEADFVDSVDEEESFPTNIQSHLNLALLDIADDSSLSTSSTDRGVSIEDYLQGRLSRTSSFDLLGFH